jgi:hypothetical protein
VANPGPATEFLAEALQPIRAADPKELTRLIGELDAEEFETRERASQALAALSLQAGPALAEALKNPRSAEQRRRLSDLCKPGVLHPERLRLLRAIEVLEALATPEARAILERLATGEPIAEETRQARAALARMRGDP